MSSQPRPASEQRPADVGRTPRRVRALRPAGRHVATSWLRESPVGDETLLCTPPLRHDVGVDELPEWLGPALRLSHSVAVPTKGDSGSRHPLHSPPRPYLLFSRAREEYFASISRSHSSRASVALAEGAQRGVPRQAGNDVHVDQGKASRRGPLPQHGAFAASTMAPAASEPSRYPRRRSRVVSVPDRPQVREHRPDGRPVPFLRTPRNLPASSRLVMARAAYFRTRGVKRTQNQRSGSRRAPRALPFVRGTAFAVTSGGGLGNGPTCLGQPDVSRRRSGGAGLPGVGSAPLGRCPT